MAYTTPRTWVAGEVLTAAQLNTDVRDNVAFLANPPACRVTKSATQSLTDGTEASVTFDTETFDTDTMHSTVTNNERITIVTAGLYVVKANLVIAAATDYVSVYGYIRLGGASVLCPVSTVGAMTDTVDVLLSGGDTFKFAAGNYIDVRARINTSGGGAKNIVVAGSSFSAVWVGIG